jgi:HD-like signal output (HDOD) protein
MPVRVQLQSVTPSMRLARPIFDGDGKLLAGPGTLLREALVRVLRRMAVQSVLVAGGDAVASWDTVRPLAEELEDLERRFAEPDPAGEPRAELHAAIARHLTARAARADEDPPAALPEEDTGTLAAVPAAAVPTPPLPSPDVLRRQLARLRSVPTLPRILERIVSALEDQNVDFESVAELIEIDQALTSQILRLANSAFYSSAGQVGRVSQALIVLGAVVSRSVLLTSGVLDLRRVPLRGFWEHSLGCAVAAGAIAKVTGLGQPEEVTAAGLMHDLGKVVLCKELPDVFACVVARATAERRPFGEVERELLEVDHCEMASWIVTRWRFPASLADPIAFHHAPGRAPTARDETAIVHVANSLVRGLGYGFGGDPRVPRVDAGAWARLGLGAERLDRVLASYEADLDRALNYALFD